MADPFIGEIRMFGGNFAPNGWAVCDGTVLAISQNDALFALIGTTYGGDGQTTFALPDLRGRLPLHQASGYVLGQAAGVEQVTLSTAELPPHQHTVIASSAAATSTSPAGNVLAQGTRRTYRDDAAPRVAMVPTASAGGSQPHTNLMPALCVNFIIALLGIFPSQG